MSELQKKIDEILSERKSRIDNISSQEALIDSLYPNLQKIQKTISELGVEGSDDKVETISKFLNNLDQAREKLRLLKKRYAKDTINIGVSGFTHAGKSTLLQAISGLTDSEIPKADEVPKILFTQQLQSVHRFSIRRRNTRRFSTRPTTSLWNL